MFRVKALYSDATRCFNPLKMARKTKGFRTLLMRLSQLWFVSFVLTNALFSVDKSIV